ncbi:MAG: 2OG-Fe dioxygenase family protein [Rubrivivax sp.]|nr:2OG-Fe dioxygenase family protein [Rubrivivax sp.]
MPNTTPPPPLTAWCDLPAQMAAAGFAVLDADATCRMAGWTELPVAWYAFWRDLPPDRYLRDRGRYRRRRHGCFTIDGAQLRLMPHRAHWQPVEYNALHGGIERWFEPLPDALTADPHWAQLLLGLAALASACHGAARWYAEAHVFRIDTTDGIGRPTPEGAHRDGVDLVAVFLVSRQGIKGGETRVFDARGPQGLRFTLTQPWSVLLLDDARVIHESTPIQPLHGAEPAHRDTLVVTLRRDGFQGPQAMLDP